MTNDHHRGDLGALLTSTIDARARADAALRPSDELLAGMHRSVRRRRTVRHATTAAFSLLAATAVGAAAWTGLQGDRDVAPAGPTPVVKSLEYVQAGPGLPTALAGGDAKTLLAKAKDDAVVIVVQPNAEDLAGSLGRGVHGAAYLVEGDGTRHHLTDLAATPSMTLERWDRGSTTALVTYRADDGLWVANLDLTTGTTRDEVGPLGDAEVEFLGESPDGADLMVTSQGDAFGLGVADLDADEPVWAGIVEVPSATAALNPSGTLVVTGAAASAPGGSFAIVDLDAQDGAALIDFTATDPRTEAGYEGVYRDTCIIAGWVDDEHFLLNCADMAETGARGDEDDTEVGRSEFLVDVSPEALAKAPVVTAEMTDNQTRPVAGSAVSLGGGAVAYARQSEAYDYCSDGVLGWRPDPTTGVGTGWVVQDGDVTGKRDVISRLQVAGGRIVVEASAGGCEGTSSPMHVRSVPIDAPDLKDDGAVVLLPPYTDTQTWPDAPRAMAESVHVTTVVASQTR